MMVYNDYCLKCVNLVPDMSIQGELSTLGGSLDVNQYCLIKGFLAHNLGEDTEHILPSVTPPPITAEVINNYISYTEELFKYKDF